MAIPFIFKSWSHLPDPVFTFTAFRKKNNVLILTKLVFIHGLFQENSLKKKLKTKRKKKRRDIDKEGGKSEQEANDQEEEEEGDANEGEQDNSGHRERASSALIPERKSKVKRKTKVKEESLDKPKVPDNNQNPLKGKK